MRRILRWSFVFLVVLLGLGTACWWQRVPLIAWYHVHRLAAATGDDRELWAARTAALGDAAFPGLIRCLCREDGQACGNAQTALACLAGTQEKGQAVVASRLADRFVAFSSAGQVSALDLAADWLRRSPAPSRVLVRPAVRLLPPGARSAAPEVRGRALGLAAILLDHECTSDERNACRELVRLTLQDPDASNRVNAVRLASTPSLGMARQVAPLLTDPDAQVRQTAMAVVGCASEAVATDDLLRCLHDQDPDVRRLCEAALRGRGLRNEDVLLGRLITDERPGVRLQVLTHLGRADLESGIWLRRLSQDPAPAIRAAAIRAAAESSAGINDQLEKMAASDPSSTIRQLAQHYLDHQKGRDAPQRVH